MDGTVVANEHPYHRHHSNRCSERKVTPSAVVGKDEDRVVSISARSHDPERNDDDEDSKAVKDKNEGLDERESAGEEDIKEDTKGNDANCK